VCIEDCGEEQEVFVFAPRFAAEQVRKRLDAQRGTSVHRGLRRRAGGFCFRSTLRCGANPKMTWNKEKI